MGPLPPTSIEAAIADLSFLDAEEQRCFLAAKLGQETIDFLRTDLGKAIRAYAVADIQTAQSRLVNVDASDADKVRKIQMEANVPAALLAYLDEVISNGEQANAELIQRQSERGNDNE